MWRYTLLTYLFLAVCIWNQVMAITLLVSHKYMQLASKTVCHQLFAAGVYHLGSARLSFSMEKFDHRQ